eukprot:g6068.t1
MKSVKLVVVGDGGIGKSSLLIRFASGNFPHEYIPTVFDNYSTDVVLDQQPISLGLWDTAGQEDYDRLRPLSYPMTDVFLLCYDLNNPVSRENARSKWLKEIKQYCPDVPIILVGCKSDLEPNNFHIEENACSGNQLAKNTGCDAYFSCSALNNVNIQAVFHCAIRTAMKGPLYNRRRKKTKRSKTTWKPTPPIMPQTGRAPWIYPETSTMSSDFALLLESSDLLALAKCKIEICDTFTVHQVIFDSSYPNLRQQIVDICRDGSIEKNDKSLLNSNFNFVIEFVYTGKCKMFEKNMSKITNKSEQMKMVKDLLFVAELLQMDELITFGNNILTSDSDLNESFTTFITDRLGHCAEGFRMGQKLTDIEISLNEENETVTTAHSIILKARSLFFQKSLEWNNKSENNILHFSDVSHAEMKVLLRCLYTDQVDWIKDVENQNVDVLRLLELSDRFQLKRLKSLVELQLSKLVDRACSNKIADCDECDVVSLLNYSVQHCAPQLEKWCLFFLSSNFLAFQKSDKNFLQNIPEKHRKYIKEHKWPPQSYLDAVAAYEVALAERKKKNTTCTVQ